MKDLHKTELEVAQNSLTVELPDIRLEDVFRERQFVCYQLPSTFRPRGNEYDQIQIKLSNQLPCAYYWWTYRGLIFASFPEGEEPPKLNEMCDYQIDPRPAIEMVKSDPDLFHVVIKMLLNEYGGQEEHGFSARGQYYTLASAKGKWRKCLEFQLFEDGKTESSIEFIIKDKGFFLAPSVAEFPGDPARDEFFLRLSPESFVALRRDEVDLSQSGLYIKREKSKVRFSIDFHSIKNEQEHYWCRSNLSHRFLKDFCRWLTERGIPSKITKRTYRKASLSDKKRHNLSSFDRDVLVLDKRIFREGASIESIVQGMQLGVDNLKGNLQTTKLTPVLEVPENSGAPILAILDADSSIFDKKNPRFDHNFADRYAELQSLRSHHAVQAVVINPNKNKDNIGTQQQYFTYEPPDWANEKESWIHQLQKVLTELQLKRLLLPDVTLSNVGLSETAFSDMVFVDFSECEYRIGRVSCIFDDRFHVANFDDFASGILKWKPFPAETIVGKIESAIGYASGQNYNNKPPKTLRLVIGHNFIWQLDEGQQGKPRRPLFPDDLIGARIANRKVPRAKSAFLVCDKNLSDHENFEEWNEIVMADPSTDIAYEKINRKAYEKFGFGKNVIKKSAFDQALGSAIGLELSSPKVGGLLKQSQDIWYCESNQSYFCGEYFPYQNNQKRAQNIRQVAAIEGKLDPAQYFSMLNVDFVRSSGFTVQPFPFKLMAESWA